MLGNQFGSAQALTIRAKCMSATEVAARKRKPPQGAECLCGVKTTGRSAVPLTRIFPLISMSVFGATRTTVPAPIVSVAAAATVSFAVTSMRASSPQSVFAEIVPDTVFHVVVSSTVIVCGCERGPIWGSYATSPAAAGAGSSPAPTPRWRRMSAPGNAADFARPFRPTRFSVASLTQKTTGTSMPLGNRAGATTSRREPAYSAAAESMSGYGIQPGRPHSVSAYVVFFTMKRMRSVSFAWVVWFVLSTCSS